MTRSGSPNFAEYHTVSQAAAYLGVSAATLRNWDRSGKLKPRRHPQNGYRIYLHEDLEAVLRSADPSFAQPAPFDWSGMGDSDHFVQFYETDEFLTQSVSSFVAAALLADQSSLIIATPPHREAVARQLVAGGVDVESARSSGRFLTFDASETLDRFMCDGAPNGKLFMENFGPIVASLGQGGRRIHAFGEMVALLWADGNRAAAVALEELWNELGKQTKFCLFCAYPIAAFHSDDEATLDGICSCHTRVIPAESFTNVVHESARLRAVTLLQQKAQSLIAEIAHRRHVEQLLENSERELLDFFENASEGIHKVGADGTVLWANKAEYTMLGYTKSEYIGRPIVEFHADADVIETILEKLGRGEILDNYPARLRCKDGTIKHVLINSSAHLEDGELMYTRCFTRDVTDRWIAEKALREADRRKDEFLATLAHELRNPLAPIRNALEMMRHEGCTREMTDQARAIMDRQVQQMTRLVDDLMDLSRISRDKIELRQQNAELAAVIQNAVETSRPLIDAAQHRLTVALPNQRVILYADPARIAQVFSNLLNNSAKYTEPGGEISLRAELQGSEVVVSVRDNGIGIAPDALAHVFDMFQQLDRSLDRAQGGLGIGLTLVRRFVELHGGSVDALSEGPGKGSQFIVRLPLAPGTTEAELAPQDSESSRPNRRVLVVDDNVDSANTLGTLLRVKGHEVRTANNGVDAIQVASSFEPDFILMDVGMPKMNGYEATRRIRQLPAGKNAFIIALTGWGQPENRRQSLEAGCSAHLVKPVDLDALDELLATGHRTS